MQLRRRRKNTPRAPPATELFQRGLCEESSEEGWTLVSLLPQKQKQHGPESATLEEVDKEWTLVDSNYWDNEPASSSCSPTDALLVTNGFETPALFTRQFTAKAAAAASASAAVPTAASALDGTLDMVVREKRWNSLGVSDCTATWTLVEEPRPALDSFVWVRSTPAVAWRRTGATGIVLWWWMLSLLLGEMGTTIWWLRSLDGWALLPPMEIACLGLILALLVLSPAQVLATACSLVVATGPALPVYSTVLLLIPDDIPTAATNGYDAAHTMIIMLISVRHLASATLEVLQSEVSRGTDASTLVTTLKQVKCKARYACMVAAGVYGMIAVLAYLGSGVLQRGASFDGSKEANHAYFWYWCSGIIQWLAGANPLMTPRGQVLSLHLLGLTCMEVRRLTESVLGDELLPRLLGAQRAQALTVRSLLQNYGRRVFFTALRCLPSLRLCAPPVPVTALVVALRRTAPALLPVLALVPRCPRDSCWLMHLIAASVCLGLFAIIAAVTFQEWRSMPRSRLRRLSLLLPRITSRKRQWLGHVLVVAARVADARTSLRLGTNVASRMGAQWFARWVLRNPVELLNE